MKTRPLFWPILGSARRPQEGSRVHGSSIFTLAAGPKKGSEMGAKMEPFGLPDPNYTHFGAPFVRNWCKKSCIEKRVLNLVGGATSTPSLYSLQRLTPLDLATLCSFFGTNFLQMVSQSEYSRIWVPQMFHSGSHFGALFGPGCKSEN